MAKRMVCMLRKKMNIAPTRKKGHPRRNKIIQKDQVISMKIDLETMTQQDFNAKYFSEDSEKRGAAKDN